MLLSLVFISLVATSQGIACQDKEVRLCPTAINTAQGEVQLCYNQTWSPVCFRNLNKNEANIICTQLGYSSNSTQIIESANISSSLGIDFVCSGSEQTVQDCAQNLLQYSCRAAIVTCTKFNCTDIELRLVGGATPWEGRVEVCVGGRWGTVCGEGWTNETAGQVCNKLGYPGEDATLCNARNDEESNPCNFTGNSCNTTACTDTHVGVQCRGYQVNNETESECNTISCDNSTQVTSDKCEMAGSMNAASSVYEVFTGLLAAALVGVVIGWLTSCLYGKLRNNKGSYDISHVARQQALDDGDSHPPNQYVTFDPNYELVASKTVTEYATLSRKTTPQVGSHDMPASVNNYSAIDNSKIVHEYRTLEPANGIADETEGGVACPRSVPMEYEIPTPLAGTGRKLTDKTQND